MTIDYKIFDRDKFTVVGSPNITDGGIASGFTQSNYIYVDNFSCPNSFVFKGKFKPTTTTIEQRLFNIGGSAQHPPLGLDCIAGRRYQLFITSDNTNIASYYDSTDFCITLNVWNYYKFSYDGSVYKLETSTDNKKYITVATITSSEAPKNTAGKLAIGSIVSDMAYTRFEGSIDLKQFSIEVDGVEVFSGSHLGTLTDKLVYLNDTKQIIKSAIEAKGVEVPTETPFRQYADKIGEISGGGRQPYTKTPNLIYTSSNSNNDYNALYNGIWTKRYRVFNNTSANSMYANTPLNLNKKFEFLYHLNIERFDYNSRIAGYDEKSTNLLMQVGVNPSRQVYTHFKQNDTDTGYVNFTSEAICNIKTDYFIKIIYNGSNKLEIFLSTDNKSFQKLGENTITINLTNLCRIYFCSSKNAGTIADLNGTIDFNYVNFLYPDEPENNWYAMS